MDTTEPEITDAAIAEAMERANETDESGVPLIVRQEWLDG